MRYGLIGYDGKMGRAIQEVFSEKGHTLVMRVNETEEKIEATPEVILDFSSPRALDRTLSYAERFNCPLVIGTTGFTQQDFEKLKSVSEKVPVVYSPNYSIGIDLVKRMLELISGQLEGWDVSIVEVHHNQKKDAPSGTALALAKTLNKDVPIHSLRMGGIFGDHTVIFANSGEVIQITHRALSRRAFALGALRSAEFALKASKGFYTFRDVLNTC